MEMATFENIQLNFIAEIKQKIRQAQFYIEYHDVINLVPLVREISWTKHITILKRCKDNKTIIKKLDSYFGV